jgi:hypothetical protein
VLCCAVLCCAVLCCAVLVVLQVLSNPELRAKYDKYGSAGLDVEFADASMIFGMLFGSELFEPIVGEFLIAAATSKGRELTEKEINHMQVSRICARWQPAAATAMLPLAACPGGCLLWVSSTDTMRADVSSQALNCGSSGCCA